MSTEHVNVDEVWESGYHAGYAAAQPRIIETAEELEALLIGALVRDGDHEPWERTDNGWRCWVYGDEAFPSGSLSFPVTVMLDPKEATK